MPEEPAWKQFEKAIAGVFERMPGARVQHNVKIVGRAGRQRQIDVLVEYPLEIKFGELIRPTVTIRICVECKDWQTKLGIADVEGFAAKLEDVGAHAGVMVATAGFDHGAEAMARDRNIFLVTATWDLVLLAKGITPPEWEFCEECCEKDRDSMPGIVEWERPSGPKSLLPLETQVIQGRCNRCFTLHAFCPDCGAVTGIIEPDYDRGIACSGVCGRVYVAKSVPCYEAKGYVETLESFDPLAVALFTMAYEGADGLSSETIEAEVKATKWQYAECSATIGLTEGKLAEWAEDEEGEGRRLVLTTSGRQIVEKYLMDPESGSYGW